MQKGLVHAAIDKGRFACRAHADHYYAREEKIDIGCGFGVASRAIGTSRVIACMVSRVAASHHALREAGVAMIGIAGRGRGREPIVRVAQTHAKYLPT